MFLLYTASFKEFGSLVCLWNKVGIPNFVSGPREYIMEGEYVILAMCSWFRIS